MKLQEVLKPLFLNNKLSNEKIKKIVLTMPENQFSAATGSELGSLADLLNHIILVDFIWLKRIAELGIYSNKIKQVIDSWDGDFNRSVFTDATDWWQWSQNLDELWLFLAENLTGSELETMIHFTGFDKVERQMKLGAALVHISSHQTHHHGAIAQVLDVWNLENSLLSSVQAFSEI